MSNPIAPDPESDKPGDTRAPDDIPIALKILLTLFMTVGLLVLFVAGSYAFSEGHGSPDMTMLAVVVVGQGATLIIAIIGLIRVKSWSSFKAGTIITLCVLALLFGLCSTGL